MNLISNHNKARLIELHDSLITPVINGENENGEDSVKLHISQQSAVEKWYRILDGCR